MKLIRFIAGGVVTETVNVLSSKVGRRFDRIELDAQDLYQLSELRPESILEWAHTWQLGFPPNMVAIDPRPEMNPTRNPRIGNGGW